MIRSSRGGLSLLLSLIVLLSLSLTASSLSSSSSSRLSWHRGSTVSNRYTSTSSRLLATTSASPPSSSSSSSSSSPDRRELWKSISGYEKKAVELLSASAMGSGSGSDDDDANANEAVKLLARSVGLKKSDPFLQLADALAVALDKDDVAEVDRLVADMKSIGLPPHISSLVARQANQGTIGSEQSYDVDGEDIDAGSTFSDTVTEKIRVKVSSFYDSEKSDPANGKYMFWYKVGIYNEGSEPVQIVARMWEIEKCKGEKEVVRGAGIMSTQPIIPPGDVFTYQSVCPLKVFPAKGKRLLGSMSGAYTMCKGNMGQHNFTVKVGKFNLILPSDKPAK